MYADDSDFLTDDNSRSEALKLIVKDCLGRSNLKVNEEKTEETVCDETPFVLFKFKTSDNYRHRGAGGGGGLGEGL